MSSEPSHDLLITGACGFLGSQIVARAVAQGLTVLATDRYGADPFRLHAVAPGAAFAAMDITQSPETLADRMRGMKAVIHCAAYGVDYRQSDLETALQVNVMASVRLLEAAAQAGARFIHIGTAYEYGPSDQPQHEDSRLAPQGIYGVSKAAGTLAVLDRAAALKAQAVVLRPFGMYGPLEGEHKLVPLIMRAALSGTPLELTPGLQIRDYVYVGDVAGACVATATIANFPSGQIINLASGNETTLRAFGDAAALASGGDTSVLRWGARAYRSDEVMRTQGTCERAFELLGWRATTTLQDGMAQTVTAERERMRGQQSNSTKT